MKFINHYYQIILIQLTILFIISVSQSYFSLIDVAALSCHCPQCGLLDAVLYDNLIAIIVITPIFSLLEKVIHLAKIRLYLHSLIVLIMWGIVNSRIGIERTQCDNLSNFFSTDILINFALPMLVGLILYIPFYRWSRKATVMLKRQP